MTIRTLASASIDGLKVVLRKSVDETKTEDITPVADDDLQFEAEANKTYVGHGILYVTGNTTPDFQYTFTGPSSPVSAYYDVGVTGTGTAFGTTTTEPVSSQTNPRFMHITFIFQNGANAGTISLDWSQAISHIGPTTLLKGSFLVIYEV